MAATTGSPPQHTTRIVAWAARREGTWTARQITEGTGLPRRDVDEVLGWLVALRRVELVVPEYAGRGRPRATGFRLID